MTSRDLELIRIAVAFDGEDIGSDEREQIAAWLRAQSAFGRGLAMALLTRTEPCACGRSHARPTERREVC